ncbi:hypothetical protein BDV38DRAFT_261171 [Aspergillus pseudotamarii]|uniref:Uncharacterized protein n=1 Tax=Aspergillus pseudotamarii TaxID=132259 RepID=A0A5N6SCI5_ASPPS|nr:uncharacterized protein BDV38DRAFT_261171 [Aspergillus pseudotamarii]KAE8132422.1 hypothetical protein BDV38DRAFT_261171 [Aspergillus pseudotamarii]
MSSSKTFLVGYASCQKLRRIGLQNFKLLRAIQAQFSQWPFHLICGCWRPVPMMRQSGSGTRQQVPYSRLSRVIQAGLIR